jgi:hypothetical protein
MTCRKRVKRRRKSHTIIKSNASFHQQDQKGGCNRQRGRRHRRHVTCLHEKFDSVQLAGGDGSMQRGVLLFESFWRSGDGKVV